MRARWQMHPAYSRPNGREKDAGTCSKNLIFFLAMKKQYPLLDPLMTTEEQRHKNPMDLTCTDVDILSRYVTDTGKILPRRITGFTALQQRHVTKVIKQARNLLLMK